MISNTDYKEEKEYVISHIIFILVLTFFSFITTQQITGSIKTQLFIVSVALLILFVLSFIHYLILIKYPDKLVKVRHNLLVFFDITILTFIIITLKENGIYLYPLYMILVMKNGFIFGTEAFYISTFLSILSWISLFFYSSYWHAHYDIIAIFAISTLTVPLLYFKLITSINKKHEDLNELLEHAQFKTIYDPLTNIYNKNKYREYLNERIALGNDFALLFINIEKFEEIREIHSHIIAETILKEVAARLQGSIEKTDFLAQLSTEEFVIITSKIKLPELNSFISKLIQKVSGTHTVSNIMIPIDINIGISLYPKDTKSPMMLMKYADNALHKASSLREKSSLYYQDTPDNN